MKMRRWCTDTDLKAIFCPSVLFLSASLILSAFTHIWNPAAFPSIFIDEVTYMQRAINLLEGLGPNDNPLHYDHPYFGQLFLAGVLKLIGYPGSILNASSSSSTGDDIQHQIQMLYAVPRVLMGILAV